MEKGQASSIAMRRNKGSYLSHTGKRNHNEIQLDPANNVCQLLHQVATVLVRADDFLLPKSICLLYLNKAVFVMRYAEGKTKKDQEIPIYSKMPPISVDVSWKDKQNKLSNYQLLRCALLHKSKEVRAGGLRLIRYITHNKLDVETLIEVNMVALVVRSIDLCSYNHSERVQAIRLTRLILQLAPELFPVGLGRCLVTIARDGNKENDRLLKAAQATLNELVVLNPTVFVQIGGVSCFLDAILQCPLQRINEALLSGLLYLLNQPESRHHCRQFHRILAPMSDFFRPSDDKEKELHEQRVQASYMAALSSLRSWAGFMTIYQPKDNALQAIIGLLSLPNEETQRNIISFMYELFRIPCGEWHNEYDAALAEHTRLTSVDPDAWKLQEGFIAAEGNNLLPHIAKYRPNLIKNYFILVLYTFMKKGLFEALCKVIVSTSLPLSIKATLLLGELLHKNNQNMPLECGEMTHALPILTQKASGKNPEQRTKASQSIDALLKLSRHFVAKQKGSGMSLYLVRMLKLKSEKQIVEKEDYSKVSKWLGKEHDEHINHALKNSRILFEAMSWNDWKWTLLLPLLTWPSTSLQMLEEPTHKIMIGRLLCHFKPSSQTFSQLELSSERTKIQAKALLAFCQFLLNVPQGLNERYLDEFLEDIKLALKKVAKERPSHDSVFSPSNLNTTASQYYFLAIGTLVESQQGYDAVLKAEIFTMMMDIVAVSVDMYSKLICTCLDYSINGENRKILVHILTKGHLSSRVYATQLLRVFARAGMPDFSRWGIQLLVEQLADENKMVALSALSVLDEALDDEEYLEAVLKETPSVPHLGDEGQLLLAKIVGSPHGFSAYHDCKFIATLLDKWSNTFNVKYVKLMQVALAESLTQLQRGDDGLYGRRTGSKHIVHDVFLLPHLYGSLTLHEQGFSVLIQHEHIQELLKTVRDGNTSTPQEIIQLKAAIWALGHLGRSGNGVKFLCSENMMIPLSSLASSCAVYSVRGAVYFAFCMLATTAQGANALQTIGWETVRRHHREDRQKLNVTVDLSQGNKAPSLHIAENGSETQEYTQKPGFYMGESEDDIENLSMMTDELDELDATPVKSRTLPHDSRPPSYFNHKRSLSDCAPVIEELGSSGSSQPPPEFSLSRKGSRIKKKILSSFRKRSGKRRDSVGSKASNSSSASERIVAFFHPKRRHRRSERSSGTDADEIESNTSHSQTFTDPNISDDEIRDDSLYSRPPLSPIASGASLSANDSSTPVSTERMGHRSASITIQGTRRRTANSISGFPGYGYRSTVTPYRRGVSESGHDDMVSKNSLRDFLASSTEKSSSSSKFFRTLLEGRSIVKSPSGCSELSSIRSFSVLNSRGSASNLLGRVTAHPVSSPVLAHPSGQCYMGLCLPIDPDNLLLDTSIKQRTFTEMLSEANAKSDSPTEPFVQNDCAVENQMFHYHTTENCLHCCASKETDEEYTSQLSQSESEVIQREKKSLVLARKEVLKLVTSLGVSFTQSQKGLIELKQRYPQSFQDVCLYTEICEILSNYSYRLGARRLLQELFMIVEFKNVFKRGKDTLKSLDPVITEAMEKRLCDCGQGASTKKKVDSSDYNDDVFKDFDDFKLADSDKEI